MKILITGANGQLGTDLQKILTAQKYEFVATDSAELNILDEVRVREFVKGNLFTHIINCAAYNNVDKAESEVELCRMLNTEAPKLLAKISREIGAVCVTYSSDFVFDGKKKSPYFEEDVANPLSAYGHSKLEGERAVLSVNKKCFVIRTSWVFGMGNNNFNKQVIGWSQGKSELSIVEDQVSSPTYAYDLADFTLKLLNSKEYGLYHFSNSGECSKREQAEYVLKKMGWQGEVKGAKTSDFSLPAKRAHYSKLDSSKFESVVGEKIPTWQNGIDRFLEEYKKSN
ncbi:MAG: dTDP-4-dehydrorhamnose reductase [Fusobacteria bacterium]|nr:dTDP-4-dehydrorhamnose reductase [Fusobacteriota bacterium]